MLKEITNKVQDCPNCTAINSFREPTEEDIIDRYSDIICKKCGMSYMVVLKYPSRIVNPIIMELLRENSIQDLAVKYKTKEEDIIPFYKSPIFYSIEMYEFIAKVLEITLKELLSFLPVTIEEYEIIKIKEKDYWYSFLY